MKKTNTKVPKKKKGRKPRVKPQTNMVQKVNVKINTTTPQQVPQQVRSLPPSVVPVPYPVIQPNSTNLIPHQLHRNPFDSVAFQEKLDTRLNNLTDVVNQLSRNNIIETLQPPPVREMINPPVQQETLQDNLQDNLPPIRDETQVPLGENEDETQVPLGGEQPVNIVTPSITTRIRIPSNREKWSLENGVITSNSTGQVIRNFKHLGGNDYINQDGVIYNARSKMIRKST